LTFHNWRPTSFISINIYHSRIEALEVMSRANKARLLHSATFAQFLNSVFALIEENMPRATYGLLCSPPKEHIEDYVYFVNV
jgi:hypothetical protein